MYWFPVIHLRPLELKMTRKEQEKLEIGLTRTPAKVFEENVHYVTAFSMDQNFVANSRPTSTVFCYKEYPRDFYVTTGKSAYHLTNPLNIHPHAWLSYNP